MTKKTEIPAPLADAAETIVTPKTVTVGGKTYAKESVRSSPLKFVTDVPVYIKFLTSAIERQIEDVKSHETRSRWIATVEDLSTEEVKELTCGAVLLKTLNERFPGGSYAGMDFELIQHDVPNKSWKAYTINRLTA